MREPKNRREPLLYNVKCIRSRRKTIFTILIHRHTYSIIFTRFSHSAKHARPNLTVDVHHVGGRENSHRVVYSNTASCVYTITDTGAGRNKTARFTLRVFIRTHMYMYTCVRHVSVIIFRAHTTPCLCRRRCVAPFSKLQLSFFFFFFYSLFASTKNPTTAEVLKNINTYV